MKNPKLIKYLHREHSNIDRIVQFKIPEPPFNRKYN